MKIRCLYLLLFVAVCQIARGNESEIEQLLNRLDSVLAQSEQYTHQKEAKLMELRRKVDNAIKPEEKLWFNQQLYDEFSTYQVDSALIYANRNLEIARNLGNRELVQVWRVRRAFLFTAQGLLNEAERELEAVDLTLLSREGKFQYYETKIFLYSHLVQFVGQRKDLNSTYYNHEKELKLEAQKYLTPQNPLYYSFLSSMHRELPRSAEGDSIMAALKDIVDHSALNTRVDAMNAYSLATMYDYEGKPESYVKYLIYSAIADVVTCNRDIASLEELSRALYNRHDIDRGYAYINHCMKCALQYPNRVRLVNISRVMDDLQKAYHERNEEQESRLQQSFYLLSALSAVLLVSFLLICYQFRKLSRSRRRLNQSNELLNNHVRELSATQQKLKQLNEELNGTNQKLAETNSRLTESNYVKEEYIGYVFSICSSYITKLEEYRKKIGRKLKAGQIDDLKALTGSTTLVQTELREFYHSFDAVFLYIYPDFVDDFNGLLRPEERIVLKEGELLNTELRIFALERLGISDSLKIAEFLHCSTQTVYNNRLRTRSKAQVSKEEFAEKVRSLGKILK